MHKLKRYEKLADEISGLIRTGILGPNDRIPSVRLACQTHDVSPATVFKAYYLLEDRGLIEARARSGYYVRQHARGNLAEPEMGRHETIAQDVDVSDLVFSVLDSLRNPHTVPFGSAFPGADLFPLARLAKSMGQGLRTVSSHQIITDQTGGNDSLKRQIALRYMLSGVLLPLEELVITNGAMEALNLCLQVVTSPGDLIAIEAPAFYASLQVLERLKLKAVEIPVHPRDGIDLDALEDILSKMPVKACWFMSSFQNPMGTSINHERKLRLIELLNRHQTPLIEDDVYSELYFGSHPPSPMKTYDAEGLVMHCGSFSKSLAPGYRVGWVAGGRFASKIFQLKLMTTISPSVPAQIAIADYLQHGGYDRHLRKLRQSLEAQQQAMLAAAAKYFPSETKVTRPVGGYFLWFEFPKQVDALKLFKVALSQGISLAPGPIFSATRAFRNCARLNYGHPWGKDSELAMEMLGKILSSFSSKEDDATSLA